VLRTKTGISKVYFVELPKDVQERFHYGSATPTGKAVTQRIGGESLADRFAQQVQKRLDERESILQGKHTPGPAELMVRREFNFHWAFLAGTAIIATVLFAIVWRRVK
jgi:Flp pilus assembly CpaF family ATPase